MDHTGEVRTIGADHVALREQVLAELRRRIVDGDYAQGERLTETRLADDFGVSRNPVREALRVVEAEGFVQILPRRGAVVATLDETAVRDLFAVREQLETLAAGLAAERATPKDVARLRRLLDDASAATDGKDFDRVAELNSAFHRAVIEVSGNRWLLVDLGRDVPPRALGLPRRRRPARTALVGGTHPPRRRHRSRRPRGGDHRRPPARRGRREGGPQRHGSAADGVALHAARVRSRGEHAVSLLAYGAQPAEAPRVAPR